MHRSHRTWSAAAAATLALAAGLNTATTASAGSAGAARGASASAKPAKVTAKHRTAIRQFRRALRSEAPAGAIAHFKAQSYASADAEPWAMEGWVEYGGADRYRYVQTPPASAVTDDAPGIRQIVWGRGGYWAVTDVMRAGGKEREVTNVGYTDPAHAYDSLVLALRYVDDAQRLLPTAPAGPIIGGRATRSVPVALPFANGFQQLTWFLDATTGSPVRLTDRIVMDGTEFSNSRLDISLWQTMPAGTSATVLDGDVPLTATIQSRPAN